MAKDKKEELKEIASRLEEPKDEFHQALGVIMKTDVKELDKYLNEQKKAKRKNG